VTIFVRRGGPNYQEGLRVMREVGEALCTINVFFVLNFFEALVQFSQARGED
jgi:succinyl-CoA synthetase beta subunit